MTLPSDEEVLAIATDAYVFGYPLVLMDITKAIDTNAETATDEKAPINQLAHIRTLPDPGDKNVVRTNQDTLYSFAWLDLSTEPMILSLPDMQSGNTDRERYWLMQIMDAWSNTLGNPGQTTTSTPAAFLLSGPGWQGEIPPDTTPLPMPTNTVWIVGRTELKDLGSEEKDKVNTLQDGMQLIPLSAWSSPGTYVPPPGTVDPGIDEDPPPQQVADMDGATFFNRLCALMTTNPPSPDDPDTMARLASIGIVPGGTVEALDPTVLQEAKKAGEARVSDYPPGETINGWSMALDLGAYDRNYDLRAYTALFGLGANLPEDAIYPSTSSLDGSTTNRFRLHFEPGQLPPVNAFWSLTAYDTKGYFITNPADKYAVGHQQSLTLNSDGSADILIQPDDPGPDLQNNWLPVGTDPFTLTIRLYAPDMQAINEGWAPPELTAES